jgi:DNA-binding transcriptional ArsR family regulator
MKPISTDKKLLSERKDLTLPIDITDPKLMKAYAHPLRIQILGLLDNRIASPNEIALELGTPLSNTSYHVRQLVALGFVELVGRTARRGAIEHHYTAKVRPTITDEGWAQLPDIVKRAIVDGLLQQTIAHVVAAAEKGGFNREEAHHSRTAGRLDEKGWRTVSRELARMLKRVEEVIAQSEQRLAKESQPDAVNTTIVMMQFVGPPQRTVQRTRSTQIAAAHDGGDILGLDQPPPRTLNT